MDFQTFWAARRSLAKQERPMERRPVEFHNPAARYEELTFPGTDGRLLRARYIRPAADAPAPTVLMYHDYGRGVRGWHHMTRFIALGYAVVALENRDTFLDVSAGWRDAPEGLAAAQFYTDAITAGYAARALPEVDSDRLMTWGEGLGGALAIAAAAEVPGVVRCAALNPLPTGFRTAWEKNCGGLYEGMHSHFRNEDPLHENAGRYFAAMDYLDCASFAALLRCPLLLGTGEMDRLSPAETQRNLAGRAGGEVRHLIYPKYEHERINFFENELLKFLHP